MVTGLGSVHCVVGGRGVTVVGSANLDLTLGLEALPGAGQTVRSDRRASGPGGKGLNQAVAAARAGADTRFVAAVGPDAEGAELLAVLAADGIEPLVRTVAAPTGLAVVLVDATGENAIVVSPGANAELLGLRPAERDAVAAADVLLVQLEVPLPTVTEAAQAARAAGTLVVLNASPWTPLDADLTDCVDLLVVNEGEARALASGRVDGVRGVATDRLEQDVDLLLGRVPAVVVTVGPHGAVYRDRGGARYDEPGLPVAAVDTTGAGDSFAGYLAAGLAAGTPVGTALRRANVAAALCVQRPGAVAAVPLRAEVDAAMQP
jgi:ribokinase